MTRSSSLRAVPQAPVEPAPSIGSPDSALRVLLRDRDRATVEIADIDAQMLAYRKRYAADRGEFLLPSLERLRRELFASGHNQ